MDERSYQEIFYEKVFGKNWRTKIHLDRSTDGYLSGILFEHKKNVRSYGFARALGQALIYLSRFNRDGIPVPRYTCLVSQDEEICYFIDNNYYLDYINDIENNAQRIASAGIPQLLETDPESILTTFSYSLKDDATDLNTFFRRNDDYFVKVDISVENVVGWSHYYYRHCSARKAKKIKFFEELRNPKDVLNLYINPWRGEEKDFRYIMDLLNDPTEQKKIGAFYTPMEYARKSCELVIDAIKRVPAGNDYVIIDRCAGTGNLEWCLNDYCEDCGDDILSHVIVSSPELKEWEVLKERLGGKVRHILPDVENPEVSENGYLIGTNALDDEFLNNPIIRRYLDDEKCSIILFENPPYAQGSSVSNQKDKVGKDACEWKNSYVVREMKKEISGTATNEMCNAFIWSAFKYYLRQPTDSYIVFAPPKYWKYHNLVNKKMIRGFGFNRQFFHASAGLISCIEWSNRDDKNTEKLELEVYSIKDDGEVKEGGYVYLQKMHSLHSSCFYDNRKFSDDIEEGILTDPNGYDIKSLSKKVRSTAKPCFNKNIIGYMVVKGCTLDTPGLNANLLITTRYDAHGCYLREDDFITRLPSFSAGQYTNNVKSWTNTIYGASADGAEHYWTDVRNGKLNDFLFKNLLWCCVTQYNHMVSQYGSDGRLYLNQICLDRGTLAREYLDNYIENGYELTEDEVELFGAYEMIKREIRSGKQEYNPDFTYGIYQIDKEIDTTYYDEKGNCCHNYGNLQNQLKAIKAKAKDYYAKEIAPILMKYELVK